MISKKDLLKRIQSLEDMLGVVYAHSRYEKYHVANEWGFVHETNEVLRDRHLAKKSKLPK